MKRLVAYSSVSHLGFCMLGMFALECRGHRRRHAADDQPRPVDRRLVPARRHALRALHTRQFDDMGGLAARLPIFACFLVFISLSSMGLPGLNGFIGEVLSLIGMFKVHPAYAVIGAAGIVLGAWYLLSMLQLTLFGPKRACAGPSRRSADLNGREILALAPIAVLCLVIGVFPQPFLDTIEPEVDAIAAIYQLSSQMRRAPR